MQAAVAAWWARNTRVPTLRYHELERCTMHITACMLWRRLEREVATGECMAACEVAFVPCIIRAECGLLVPSIFTCAASRACSVSAVQK